MRFTSVQDVMRTAKSIEAYVREAIEVEKAGLKVEKGPALEYLEEPSTRLTKTLTSKLLLTD